MILPVVKYGDPVLRQKGAQVERITPELKRLISDMFETMYAAKGIGLAAQQVGRAVQLTVIDVTGIKDRPSTMEIDGYSVKVESAMPMVLINPEIRPLEGPILGPEGCLSFPELYAEISRPAAITVKAMNEMGETVEFRCGGLLARAVQHENDHLQGILFIDRMSREDKAEMQEQLDQLQAATRAALKK